MKHKLIYWFSIGGLIISLVYIIVTTGLQLLPQSPLTITEPIKILNENKVVRLGEAIHTEISYCKNSNAAGESRARLLATKVVDKIGEIKNEFTIPQVVTGASPKGCRISELKTWVVPYYVTPQKYVFELTTTYKINQFRTIEIKALSELFTVIHGTPSANLR
jgi:hypothetical protein